MTGRRNDTELHNMDVGDYGKSPIDGTWICKTPTGLGGILGRHEITEHEDRTITVSPSILVQQPQHASKTLEWHGYLERGVWREV